MPSVYDLKPKFQALLRPLVKRVADRGITPNQVTLAALGLSVAGGALLWLSDGSALALLLIPVILFARMALNAIDGMLAREHQMTSRLGQVLNEIGDVLSDTVLYLPFAIVPGVSPWLVVLVIIAAIMTEFAGLLAQVMTGTRHYEGPMGKSDRALLFGTLSVILVLRILPVLWVSGLLLAALLLSAATVFNRLKPALKETP